MASTVFYGKSVTAAGVQEKVVRLKNLTDEEVAAMQDASLIKPGDLLTVYFAQKNLAEGISLILRIEDSNEETGLETDQGKTAFQTSNVPVVNGAWSDGETVTFVYTQEEDTNGVPTNNYFWETVDGGLASNTTYGITILDEDDNPNSAVSLAKVNELLGNVGAGTELQFVSNLEDSMVKLGDLSLIQNEEPITTVALYGPAIPVNTSSFVNNGSGTVTNGFYLEKGDTDTETYIKQLINAGYIQTAIDSGFIKSQLGDEFVTDIINVDYINNLLNGDDIYAKLQESLEYTTDLASNFIRIDNKIDNLPRDLRYEIVYTYDIQYPAGSAVPTSTKKASGTAPDDGAWDNTFIELNSSNNPTTHIFVECPTITDYTPIGVIGVNVSDGKASWSEGSKAPSKFYLWAFGIQVKDNKRCVHFQGTNRSDKANNIRVAFRVLYMRN